LFIITAACKGLCLFGNVAYFTCSAKKLGEISIGKLEFICLKEMNHSTQFSFLEKLLIIQAITNIKKSQL